jgi:biotin carboxyl carrier protein
VRVKILLKFRSSATLLVANLYASVDLPLSMRRRHFRHEQKTFPRIVGGGAVTAAAAPGLVAAEKFFTITLDASPATGEGISGSAAISLGRETYGAHFHTSAASTEIVIDGFYYRLTHAAFKGDGGDGAGATELRSEIPGKIIKITARLGDVVQAGDALLIQEAMKMEMTLKATGPCRVKEILVEAGAQVDADTVLIRFEAVQV